MSAREWKPGDVALVHNEHGVWNVAICTLRADRLGWWWRYGVADSWSPITAEARPLVVIDPEDREQVTRLSARIAAAECGDGMGPLDAVQAALRSLVEPPKPEEPMSIGAMVTASYRDDDGKGFGPATWARGGDGTWVCLTDGMVGHVVPWPFLCDVELTP